MGVEPVFEGARFQRQQGPGKAHAVALNVSGHARQPGYACAAAQGQQDAFGLIVCMLAQQYHVGACGVGGLCQGAVASFAGAGFDTVARLQLDVDMQGHMAQHAGQGGGGLLQRRAKCCAMFGKAVCTGLQPVMDVQGGDGVWPVSREGGRCRWAA